MPNFMTRRHAMALGSLAAGSLFTAGATNDAFAFAAEASQSEFPGSFAGEIHQILGAKPSMTHGLLHVGIDRKDIQNVELRGTPITPAFQINGDLFFQMLPDGHTALMNGDFALKPSELNPFIHQLIAHQIIFQAEHQHLFNYEPMVWFVHFRAKGDPVQIARGFKAALDTTSTPFPQSQPKNAKSPLPAEAMGKILGAKPTIKDGGVVSFSVPRAEHIRLGGEAANPYLNIAAPIAFQPLGDSGKAAAVPDFAMLAAEVNTVVGVMQSQGWEIGCLYNQETDEHPQLYFSHQFKTGDALELAREIRKGLDHTNSKFM